MVEHLAAFTFVIENAIRKAFPGIFTIYAFGDIITEDFEDDELSEGRSIKERLEGDEEFESAGKDVVHRPFKVEVDGDLLYLRYGVNVINREGWSPLHACCHSPTTEEAALKIIDEMSETNGRFNLVTYIGPGESTKNWTCLHIATAYGVESIVRKLVEKGAKVDTMNSEGWTPLMEACRRNYVSLVEFLLSEGANADRHIPTQHMGIASSFPSSCLSIAARNGFEDIVKKLLEAGADKDKQNEIGWAPLHEACHMNHVRIVKSLIFYGADVCLKTTQGRTPYDLASSDEILQCLHDAMSEDQRKSISTIRSTRCSFGDDEDEQIYRELEIDSKYDLLMDEEENELVCSAPKKLSRSQMNRRRMSLARRESNDDVVDAVVPSSRFRLLGHLPSLEDEPGPPEDEPAPPDTDPEEDINNRRKKQKKRKKKKKKRKKGSKKDEHNDADKETPKMFLCEICGKLIRHAVQCPYGHVYERDAIRSYLKKYGYKCPFSGLPLAASDLMPATQLQHAINEYKENRKAEKLRNSSPSPTSLSSPLVSPSMTMMSSKDNDGDDDLYDFS